MMEQKTVYVKDYTLPGEEDSAQGIRKAIAKAKETSAKMIKFEAGVYLLKSTIRHKTDQSNHDSGGEQLPYKDVHILLEGMDDFVFCGAVDENKKPATEFAGYNNLRQNELLPSILWCEHCNHLTMKDFALNRTPSFASAGKVIKKTENETQVEVFPGNPCYDNMGTYCMNRFLPNSRTLYGESVTYGAGASEPFRLVGGNVLCLSDSAVSKKVEVDEILSWHQGAKTDFQFFMGNCDDLVLENIHTKNANGFAMLSFHIHNLIATNIKVKPEGNQYFAAPRDAWKLHKCSGTIEMKGLEIEGVRMDGQNMHSNYMFIKNIISPRKVQFFTRYNYTPLKHNTDIEFYEGTEFVSSKILDWSYDGVFEEEKVGGLYTVLFEDDIPGFVNMNTLALASCWEPNQYICRDSVFTNIAGAGHLSRIDNMTILNCKYQNLMNSGILMGAEFPNHTEGGHCRNIVIKGCEFDNCGFFPRYGAKGGIGIKSFGLSGENNKNIRITRCTFKNSDIGVDIHDAKGVVIADCLFQNNKENIRIDKSTTSQVYINSLEGDII